MKKKTLLIRTVGCILPAAVCAGALAALFILHGRQEEVRRLLIARAAEEQQAIYEELERENLRIAAEREELERQKALLLEKQRQAEKRPAVDIDSWEFVLANSWNSVAEYKPETGTVEGIELDKRIVPAMEEFLQDARSEGMSVVLASGYRSYEEQSWLFQEKVYQYGDEDAAAAIVARPGTSEHQTGLAADITDQYYEIKKQSLEETALYQWMQEHCQEYGFIVRFPEGKEEITGIIYEPWHFRYVGKEAAAYIMENDLTLEEFLELYQEKES